MTTAKLTDKAGKLNNEALTDITNLAVETDKGWTIEWTAPSDGNYEMFSSGAMVQVKLMNQLLNQHIPLITIQKKELML